MFVELIETKFVQISWTVKRWKLNSAVIRYPNSVFLEEKTLLEIYIKNPHGNRGF